MAVVAVSFNMLGIIDSSSVKMFVNDAFLPCPSQKKRGMCIESGIYEGTAGTQELEVRNISISNEATTVDAHSSKIVEIGENGFGMKIGIWDMVFRK